MLLNTPECSVFQSANWHKMNILFYLSRREERFLKIFEFNITRKNKTPFKVYKNDCRYCSCFEQIIDNESEIIFGRCSELSQIVYNDMKYCKHKDNI